MMEGGWYEKRGVFVRNALRRAVGTRKAGFSYGMVCGGVRHCGPDPQSIETGIPDQVRDDVVQHGGDGSGMTGRR